MNKPQPILLLVRHGEDEYNREGKLNGRANSDLTQAGLLQAKEVANNLFSYKPHFIFSSPLLRAANTAKIIKKELKISSNVEIVNDLIERDYGSLTGTLVSDLAKNCQELLAIGELTYPITAEGLETMESLKVRADRVVNSILSHPTAVFPAIVVTHREIGKMIWMSFNKINRWEEGLKIAPKFPNTGVIALCRN